MRTFLNRTAMHRNLLALGASLVTIVAFSNTALAVTGCGVTSGPGQICSTGQNYCSASGVNVKCSSVPPTGNTGISADANADWSCNTCNDSGFYWQCKGGFMQCGNTCFANPVCGANASASCGSGGTAPSCSCNGGYVSCSGVCTLGTLPSACFTPVFVNQSTAQAGYINVAGDIKTGGDYYLSNGKSIHVGDVAAGSRFNIGNWGTAGSADGSKLTMNFFSGMLVAGVKNPDYVAFPTTAFQTGALNLAAAENLYYGAIDSGSAGSFLRFETALTTASTPASTVYTPRFIVSKDGTLTINAPTGTTSKLLDLQINGTSKFSVDNLGNVTMSGVAAGGACGGRQLVGFTSVTTGKVGVGGYDAADTACDTAGVAGSGWKVCTSEEVLNSYKCGGGTSYIRNTAPDGAAWVNAGPPGYVAWSNDCNAWQNDVAANGITYFGRVWQFTKAGKGYGTLTVCTASLRVACCK